MILYKTLEKIIGNYFFSRVNAENAEELKKIPKEGPVIIASTHPKWWDAAILYMCINKIVGRKAKFLTSKNVSDFSECYKSTTKHIKKNGNALTKALTPLLATIPAILIPYMVKRSGPLFVSKYRKGGCSKEAIYGAKEWLKNGGIVCFYVQGGTRNEEEEIGHLKNGAAYVAYTLHDEERIDVPVYPVLVKGVGKSAVPHKSRIRIKVGNSLFVKDYLIEENHKEILKRFTEEIKARMMSL